MSGGLVIRDAQPSDAPAIAAVYNQTVAAQDATMDTEPKSDAQIARQIAELGAHEALLVQMRDGQLLGFGRVMGYSERAGYATTCETAVYLDRGLRRQGLGTLLKRAVIARARQLGYHHLVAKVLSSNAASIRYNLALGYDIVGVQREAGRLDGRWVDVTIMQLVLEDEAAL